MKKLLIILFLLIPSLAFGATFSVCNSGCDKTTIALALAECTTGTANTITVQDVYSTESTVTITKSGAGVGNEIVITASGQLGPKFVIKGSYVKITGFTFVQSRLGSAASYAIRDEGGYNIIDGNTFYGRGPTVAGQQADQYLFSATGSYGKFINNSINWWWYQVFSLETGTSYYLIDNNTVKELTKADLFWVHGHDHTISNNVITDHSAYGLTWSALETLALGQTRKTSNVALWATLWASTGGYPTVQWEVTTAGTTGATEPEYFDLSGGIVYGSTINDGSVVWTARMQQSQHPDFIQVFGDYWPEKNAYNLTFINNSSLCFDTVQGTDGKYGVQVGNITADGSDNIRDWTFINNIWNNQRALNTNVSGLKFYNNIFFDMAQSTISGGVSVRVGRSTGMVLKNNVFLGNIDSSESAGWYGLPFTTRQNSTAYNGDSLLNPASGFDGWHVWKPGGSCTSGGSEPSELSDLTSSFTADGAIDTNTLTNVSSFDNVHLLSWLKKDGYVHNNCYIDEIDEVAGTITMRGHAIYPVYSTHKYCNIKNFSGVTFNPVINNAETPPALEELLNTTFDTDTSYWTGTNATLAQETSGRWGKALKITTTAGGGYAYQIIPDLLSMIQHHFLFYYKNASEDVAQYAVYDLSSSSYIVSPTDLTGSTSWSEWKGIKFFAPSIAELGETSFDIEGMTSANPCVVTITQHLTSINGGFVRFSGITQASWTALNDTVYFTEYVGGSTFKLRDVSTGAYISTAGYAAYNATTDPGKMYKARTTGYDIEGLSRANPCVVTHVGHGLSTGQYVRFSGIVQSGWTALNTGGSYGGAYKITKVDNDSYSLDGLDTSGYASAYLTSDAGKVWQSKPVRIEIGGKNSGDIVYFDYPSVRTVIASPDPSMYITVTDGTCTLKAVHRNGDTDADYNYVAHANFSKKTYFEGAETHGVIQGDPKFTDKATGDFTISDESSVLIGAGVELNSIFTTDKAGTTRGSTWDIGAYEYEEGEADTEDPVVTEFVIPATSSILTVAITTFTATDNVAVTHYLINESSETPLDTDLGWSVVKQTSYTFDNQGVKTLYAWAMDAAKNISLSASDSVTITLETPSVAVGVGVGVGADISCGVGCTVMEVK